MDSTFQLAIQGGKFDIVKLLFETLTIHLNTVYANGSTALNSACKKSDYHTVKFLLGNHADVNQCDKYGTSPIINTFNYRITWNIIDILQLLLKCGASVNYTCLEGKSALTRLASVSFDEKLWPEIYILLILKSFYIQTASTMA